MARADDKGRDGERVVSHLEDDVVVATGADLVRFYELSACAHVRKL